jgi:hypothetical protein
MNNSVAVYCVTGGNTNTSLPWIDLMLPQRGSARVDPVVPLSELQHMCVCCPALRFGFCVCSASASSRFRLSTCTYLCCHDIMALLLPVWFALIWSGCPCSIDPIIQILCTYRLVGWMVVLAMRKWEINKRWCSGYAALSPECSLSLYYQFGLYASADWHWTVSWCAMYSQYLNTWAICVWCCLLCCN